MRNGIYQGIDFSGDFNLSTEVLVIGSGWSGSMAAQIFTENGYDVTVVEKGNYFPPEELGKSEIGSFTNFYKKGIVFNRENSIFFLEPNLLGGSSVVDWGNFYPLGPEEIASVFKKYSFSVKEIKTAIEKLTKDLSIITPEDEAANENNRLFKRIFSSYCLVNTVLRHTYECAECGLCMRGCRYNRKQSALITLIPRAKFLGAKIYTNFDVEKIYPGEELSAVEGRILAKNATYNFRIKSKIIILTSGVKDTLRIFSNSGFIHYYLSHDQLTYLTFPVFALSDKIINSHIGIPQLYYCNKDAPYKYFIAPYSFYPGFASFFFDSPEPLLRFDHFFISGITFPVNLEGLKKGKFLNEIKRGIRFTVETLLENSFKKIYIPLKYLSEITSFRQLSKLDYVPLHPPFTKFFSFYSASSSVLQKLLDENGRIFKSPGKIYVFNSALIPPDYNLPHSFLLLLLSYLISKRIS